jgi:hypothetical protein
MNKWVKQKWLHALKSGEYGKGKGRLGHPGRNQYCCLGVLACEMVPEFVHVNRYSNELTVGDAWNRASYLPDDLAIMYGLDWETQEQLGIINDEGSDFGPVIAYIENNL